LCAQKIVGLCQRGLSACELQLHAQGLYNVLEDGNKSKRTFSFTYGGGSTILPLDSDPCFRLGYNYVVGVWGAGVAGWRVGTMRASRQFWEILYQAKTSARERLCRDLASNRIGVAR